jgi:hypothetical protein
MGAAVLKRLFRLFRAAALLLFAIGLAVLGLLVYPQPLFAHSVVVDGRLELWSDQPFDADAGRRVLADIDNRISRSPLDKHDGVHRVFIVNARWRARLLFLWSYGAGGLNYYPLTRNVFIRRSDIEAGRVLRWSGELVEAPRTLAYYGAHEIAHSLTGEAVGPLRYHRLPAWVREGLADCIALPDQRDLETLQARLAAGDPALDPRKSGLYTRYRLLVMLALEKHDWTLERLLKTPPSKQEAEKQLL